MVIGAEDRIGHPWGERSPFGSGERWPVRVDQSLAPGIGEEDVERWVPSACVLCSYGCGLDIAVRNGQIVGVRGRENDRVNHGRLGPKGLFGWQANNSSKRLTRPLIRREGRLVETDWDEAMGLIVDRARELLDQRSPLSFGFYTSGQMFLEEYYTQTVMARGGIGTPHLDGNTRLCTATAAQALMESFGADGDPGSYTDFDSCDTLFLVGHNMAETQTVGWSRILDRLSGPDRPRLVVVDPRMTPTAAAADVHLRPLPGTNLALLNAIVGELIRNDWIDGDYVETHTIGFEALRSVCMSWPVERAAEVCDVDPNLIREAARVIGRAERLVSTCLQGVYQSNQATASACQVNNIHLLRGMLGRPGATVFQMNGQPTAENTRECGADGGFPGFRNWANPAHVAELAELWNVELLQIPHWGPPTHAMEIFRQAEEGAIRFLWVTASNPAVSLPELDRVRSILGDERLFLVVSDAFMTETAEFADVVLPAALWGEKTGCFTNADRTVHLSEKAVEPPGQARSELDAFIDFASRMNLTDKDGAPLIKWSTPLEAFEAWKACSAGRPCDYSGLTYDMLRSGPRQWPCNEANPEGLERLYADGDFPTDSEACEEYGHDFVTGAPYTEADHRYMSPDRRAILRSADYQPPAEPPNAEYPMALITGRRLFHFHTRTKTGRARELVSAAPGPWVEISADDAAQFAVGEWDMVRVETARGAIEAPVHIGNLRPGTIFLPFHYGYWDVSDPDAPPRAANELTRTEWDPVSRQPLLKAGAAKLIPLPTAEPPARPVPEASAAGVEPR